jgi:hypothetical protein
MSQIKIEKYTFRSACDIHRCTGRSEVSVGVPGESKVFNHNYCEEHLKQIVAEGIKYFMDNYGPDSLNEIDALKNSIDPEEHEALQKMCDELLEKLKEKKAEEDAKEEVGNSESVIDLRAIDRNTLVKIATGIVPGKTGTMKTDVLISEIQNIVKPKGKNEGGITQDEKPDRESTGQNPG